MRALDSRLLLLALPALTASVLVVVLVGGLAERSVRAARVYGGPTGAPEQSYRLELVDSHRGVQTPAAGGSLRVVVRGPAGRELAWTGSAGADGVAEVPSLALPPAERYELSVLQGDAVLAAGSVGLSAEAWLSAATRRGGWRAVKLDDTTDIELAPARGVLAVPFASELLLRVRRNGQPLKATLELAAEGASVQNARTTSDEMPGRIALTPSAHAVELRVSVQPEGEAPREVKTTLTVVAGAFDAVLDGEQLIVTSPVPRERAYFTLVTAHRRVGGGSLALGSDGRGGASGRAQLPPLPAEPIWAVVASSPDLVSAARVGYPIGNQAEPARTLDVPERLLLDGLPRALSRESGRRKKVRLVAAAVCALSLLLGVLLLAWRSQRSAHALARHFEQSGLAAEERRALSSQPSLWLTTALAAVGLGFVALLIFALVLNR
ncbi:MAG TPA: hypothetical protein VM686_07745 [Polyangiaceae bacterium]|nr:hypothetical protein [Polyangiaceae bacterium]